MARPRKINSKFWVHYYRKFRGKSIRWIANKYNVSKRTVWRYLKWMIEIYKNILDAIVVNIGEWETINTLAKNVKQK